MGTLRRSGRVEAIAEATPEQVWAVIADVTRIGEWSHECRGASWLDGASRAHPGARFAGRNRLGRTRWSRRSEFIVVDAPRELEWRTIPTRMFPDSTRWTIRLEPEGAATRIIQTFEVLKLNPVLDRLFYLLLPPHRDRLPALTEDLVRLGRVAASASTVAAGAGQWDLGAAR